MIFAYIYDFISFLFEKNLKEEIKNIILYGSAASGEFDEQSDIDIFIEVWDKNKKPKIEEKIKEQLNKFEDVASRIWYPRGIKNRFSIIIDNLDSPKWENLKYDIISNGILLYGKFEKMLEKEKMLHEVLVTFSLNKLKQPKKMRFVRELYGYKLKKGKKKLYGKEGLLDIYKGIKISSNSILIPIEKIKEFRKLFSRFRITPEIREIWMR